MCVYCGSAYRAAAATSLLDHHGWENASHVDDNFGNAAPAGFPIVVEQAPEREPGWTSIASREAVRSAGDRVWQTTS